MVGDGFVETPRAREWVADISVTDDPVAYARMALRVAHGGHTHWPSMVTALEQLLDVQAPGWRDTEPAVARGAPFEKSEEELERRLEASHEALTGALARAADLEAELHERTEQLRLTVVGTDAELAQMTRDRDAARAAAKWLVAWVGLVASRSELLRMAADGGGVSCPVMEEIAAAIEEAPKP